MEIAVRQLVSDEGFRANPYRDHLGYWTIGHGILIDERRGGGITEDESLLILRHRIGRIHETLRRDHGDWYDLLTENRQAVILNMCYQLGTPGFLKFSKTVNYIKAGDYQAAAAEMLDSKWAREDTPARARRLSEQFAEG